MLLLPTVNANGITKITITVSDGTLDTYVTFNLTVSAVNDKPTIVGTANSDVDQDVFYSFVPTVDDVDGDTLVLIL